MQRREFITLPGSVTAMQAPAKYQRGINLKTAKVLGPEVPPALEVIE